MALVREPDLVLLREVDSVFALANKTLFESSRLSQVAEQLLLNDRLNYNAICDGQSEWKLRAPIDCPGQPQRVHVSGAGLTHLGSARDRQVMHAAQAANEVAQMTDSMYMFEWGRQQGRPAEGAIGIAPEWFYKGDGSVVQRPFGLVMIPRFAEDGREEAEVSAIYLIV